MMHNFTPVFTPESHILSSSSLYTRFHGRFELVVLLCWSSSTLLVYLIVLYRVMDWFLAHRFNQMSFVNEQILLEFHHFVNSLKRLSRFWMKAHLGQNSRGNFLLLCYLHHQFISLYRRGVHSMQLQVSIQQDTGVGTRWRQCGLILFLRGKDLIALSKFLTVWPDSYVLMFTLSSSWSPPKPLCCRKDIPTKK
jgi:hypothetical protein